MKKLIIILILLVTTLFLHQAYWYKAFGGNLTIWIHNQTENELIDDIEVYLDDVKIIHDSFSNNRLDYKLYTFNVSPGKHTLKVKSKNEKLNNEYSFVSILVKRTIIYFSDNYNISTKSMDVSTQIHSENVFATFEIN